MIRSMTAFASGSAEFEDTECLWEIRSVNHRYLELFFRLPDELRVLEGDFRKRISGRLKRGKLDCIPVCRRRTAQDDSLSVDLQRVQSLFQAADRVTAICPDLKPLSVMEVMKWPGVQIEAAPDPEAVKSAALASLDRTLDSLLEFRLREGARMAEVIEARRCSFLEYVQEIRSRIPAIRDRLRETLRARLDELGVDVDRDRFEQEVVFVLQKMDVDEELERLLTHLDEIGRILKSDEVAGRRLDFLLQELNRETNTLGSKSVDSYTSTSAVEMKVLIEQMREQVQNIE